MPKRKSSGSLHKPAGVDVTVSEPAKLGDHDSPTLDAESKVEQMDTKRTKLCPAAPLRCQRVCAICASPCTQLCSRCRVACYCGVEHQKQDWIRRHKTACCQLLPAASITELIRTWAFPDLYNLLLDACTLRAVDDAEWGSDRFHGSCDGIDVNRPARSAAIVDDLLLFCKLTLARRMLPEGVNWAEMLKGATAKLLAPVQRAELDRKYGNVNLLRSFATAVLGCGAISLREARSLGITAAEILADGFAFPPPSPYPDDMAEGMQDDMIAYGFAWGAERLDPASAITPVAPEVAATYTRERFLAEVGGTAIWAHLLDEVRAVRAERKDKSPTASDVEADDVEDSE